jgi:hypothetical protein
MDFVLGFWQEGNYGKIVVAKFMNLVGFELPVVGLVVQYLIHKTMKYLVCDKVKSQCGTVEVKENSAFQSFYFLRAGINSCWI